MRQHTVHLEHGYTFKFWFERSTFGNPLSQRTGVPTRLRNPNIHCQVTDNAEQQYDGTGDR